MILMDEDQLKDIHDAQMELIHEMYSEELEKPRTLQEMLNSIRQKDRYTTKELLQYLKDVYL